MDVTQDSEGFLYNLIVEGVNYGELPHMDRAAVAKAIEAAKKGKGGKKGKAEEEETVEVEQEEEEEPEPEPEPEAEEEEGKPKKKKAAPKKKAKAAPKKKVVKKVITKQKDVNVFDLEEGEDINQMGGDQSLESMMSNLTMKIDPEMIAKYQQHQQEEQKKEENFESFGGLVDLGRGFVDKQKTSEPVKKIGGSLEKKALPKPINARQGTGYGMPGASGMGMGMGQQYDEFGNPLNPQMGMNTTSVDNAFGMGNQNMMGGMGGGMGYGQQGMGMGGMNNMGGGMGYGQQGMGMGGMNNMGMGGMNNMGGGMGYGQQGGFGF